MFRHLACIACATITLFAALPAAADSFATARVHSFNYTLIDLAPDDGHTPWLQFGPAPTASARVWLYNTIPMGYQDWTKTYYQGAGASPLDYAYASSNAQMSAHLDPRQPLAEMQLESSNMARSVNGSVTYNGVDLSTGQMRFNVSAYTAVVFTAAIDYDVRATAPSTFEETVSGYSIMEAGLDGQGWDSSYAGFNPMQIEFGPRHYTGQSLLFVSQINDGAAQTGGYLDLSLITFAGSALPVGPQPVPEPGSLGMLLAGGLLVGAVLQRRRRACALLQAAVLAPALLAAAPASASETNGSIRVQELSFILVDLRPSDGIAPSLTYTGTGQKSYYATIVDSSLGAMPAVDVHASAFPSAPVGNSYATPWHQAQLALAARPTINTIDDGASFTLSSWADHPDSVEVGYTSKLDFLLGPGTAVLFTAHARGHADFGGGSIPGDAYFSAHMDASWFPESSNASDFYQSFGSTLLPSSADVNWLLLASARNTGTDPYFMTLTIEAALGGTVTAVPEPEAVWMLLAGGLMLAAAVRRTSGARPRPQRAGSAG